MRRRSGRLSALVAVTALATLAGCGMGGTTSGDSQKTVDAGAAIKGTITFQTWSLKGDKFTPYFTALIDAFKAKHPGVSISWVDQPGDGYPDKVTSQVTSNSLPDVVNLPPDIAHSVAQAGALLDLTTNDKNLTANYVKSGLGAYTYPDAKGTFAYPWYLGTDVNFWNGEMFSKVGLDAKNPPKSFDELLAAAKVMHDKSGGKDFLMSRKPGLSDFVNAGVALTDPAGKKFVFNNAAAEAVVAKYAAAYKAGYMPSNVLASDYQGNSALFGKAEVAWTTGTGYFIQGIAQSNPTLAKHILPSAAIGTPPLYVQGIAVSSKSKNLPLALAFAQFVTDNDNQVAFVKLAQGFLPGSSAAAADPQFSKSDGTPEGDAAVLAYQGMQKAVVFTPPSWTDAMQTFMDQQIALAVSGKQSPKQALDNAVTKANQLLGS
jgi:multiple sugar transport system substrate-binding protein